MVQPVPLSVIGKSVVLDAEVPRTHSLPLHALVAYVVVCVIVYVQEDDCWSEVFTMDCISVPAQSDGLHVQLPLLQYCLFAGLHVVPQAPQLLLSDVRSTQVLPHNMSGLQFATQACALGLQTNPVLQRRQESPAVAHTPTMPAALLFWTASALVQNCPGVIVQSF